MDSIAPSLSSVNLDLMNYHSSVSLPFSAPATRKNGYNPRRPFFPFR